MNDDTEQTQAGKSPEDSKKSAGPLAGERLAAARRAQHITVLEVAKELHLDEPKVRALEQNNFEVLGAPVFAKGHLRKYAMLVGVDNDDVLQDYYKLNRAAGMPPVVGKVRKPIRKMSPGRWIAAFVVLLVAATAYWWFLPADTPQPTVPELQPPISEPIAADPDGTDVVDTDTESDNATALIEAVEVELSEPVTVETSPPVTPATSPVAGEVRLTLRFTGDCWTEISDASGRRLFFDLGRDGRSVNVSGQAPLSVLFGNADNVSVRVNGMAYNISAADRRGDETARLTIN
ncbi:MAG: helix-turn-helix domain-containing protein [Proteobacteria bacterium]|nr:helix-turn-helix domain-containing protein [Pseudomonadota bacterium]